MIKFLKLRMKLDFFRRENILILFMIMFFSFIILYSINYFVDLPKRSNIIVIDHDQTTLSSQLKEKLQIDPELNVKVLKELKEGLNFLEHGKYDLLYVIKKGYQEKLGRENYDQLIKVYYGNTIGSKNLINEKISVEIIQEMIYKKIYSLTSGKINNVGERLKKNYEENRILTLEYTNFNKKIDSEELSFWQMGIHYFWAFILLYLIISDGQKIMNEKVKGLIKRLELTGINKLKYYIVVIFNSCFKNLVYYFISFSILLAIMDKAIDFQLFKVLSVYVIIQWVYIVLGIIIFNSQKKYIYYSQGYLFFNIIICLPLLNKIFLRYGLLEYIFPIKKFIYFFT